MYKVIDPVSLKVLTDLPTPRLIQAQGENPFGKLDARLLPSGKCLIAYLADGSEPDCAKAFPVQQVRVVLN
jgi:hypothetical protein